MRKRACFIRRKLRKGGRKVGRKEGGLWEPAKHSGLISSSKKERERERREEGGEKSFSSAVSLN